jgi:hypothetical protein
MSGLVVSVDDGEKTAVVQPNALSDDDGSGETFVCNLQSISENNDGFIIYPKENTAVMIAEIDGPGEYAIIKTSSIDKVVITIGNQVFTMDGTKFGLVNGGESMKKILDDLLDGINAITVPTNAGPSLEPINAPTFTAIKTRVDNFLSA